MPQLRPSTAKSTFLKSINDLNVYQPTWPADTEPSTQQQQHTHYFFFNLLKYNWSTMLHQSLLQAKWLSYTAYEHSFYILLYWGLSQHVEYSSLCYIVGPCCPSILSQLASTNPKLPVHPVPSPLGNHKPVLYVCESVSILQTGSFVPYFR